METVLSKLRQSNFELTNGIPFPWPVVKQSGRGNKGERSMSGWKRGGGGTTVQLLLCHATIMH